MISSYKKLCTRYYDLEDHKDHEEALAYYLLKAAETTGTILEPMCGTGRFLLPVLQAGYEIEGFDASQDMITALYEKCSDLHLKKPIISQSLVHEFSSDKKYTLIFIPYGSWGLMLDKEIIEQSLIRLYTLLEKGGTLILEIETIASAPRSCGVKNRSVKPSGKDELFVLTTVLNYIQDSQLFTAYCRYELLQSGNIQETEHEDFAMHLYAYNEMDILLKNCGFTKIKKYRNHALDKDFLEEAPLLLYECIK